MAETDLKFDEQKVCTELAEHYVNNKTEFFSIGLDCHPKEDYELDRFNKKVYYTDLPEIQILSQNERNENVKKFLALAHKIEQNIELFCQLEYMLRDIPMDDTKNVDLELIRQSLLYKNTFLNAEETTCHCIIPIKKDTPLFHLGLLAYKQADVQIVIICSRDTVAVCTLFVELCCQVGLEDHVALAVLSEETLNQVWINFDRVLSGGCVGVVGARSDVDSAVDALLAASPRYPWKLGRVLVQEAAMDRFKRALEWKTRGTDSPFILEGDLVQESSGVSVEGYRSVREALVLLEGYNPLAVTLWASDVAEAFEIAFGVSADLVWVNSYGRFQGPPAATTALYCRLNQYRMQRRLKTPLAPSTLENLRLCSAEWRALAPTTRFEKVRAAIDEFHKCSDRRIDAVGLSSNSTVAVDNIVCILTRKPVDFTVFSNKYLEQSLSQCLNYLVDGGAIVIDTILDSALRLLIVSLSKAGAPVFNIGDSSLNDVRDFDVSLAYKVKAIWTNIGTIFAN